MNYVKHLAVIALGLVLTAGAEPPGGSQRSLLIRSSDVIAHTEADTSVGQYYTVSYQLPSDLHIEDLENAILEIYLTVRAKPRTEASNGPEGNVPEHTIQYINEAPVVEVFALREAYTGSVDLERLDTATKASRPVALGASRRVLIDVTSIVRAQLDGSAANFGFILGSVTGEREGDFSVVSDRFPHGAVARLRFYTMKTRSK